MQLAPCNRGSIQRALFRLFKCRVDPYHSKNGYIEMWSAMKNR